MTRHQRLHWDSAACLAVMVKRPRRASMARTRVRYRLGKGGTRAWNPIGSVPPAEIDGGGPTGSGGHRRTAPDGHRRGDGVVQPQPLQWRKVRSRKTSQSVVKKLKIDCER